MKGKRKTFGLTKDGNEVGLYILKNQNGMEVHLSDFGAIIQKIIFPDKNGNPTDVVLGFDSLEEYFDNDMALGSFVGRNANRIAGAKVTIGGKVYELDKNDGENNLHSGFQRSGYMLFSADMGEEEDMFSVSFTGTFSDMEQGFPGSADVTVMYSLNEANELIITYFAISEEDTVMNLTNHSYFNLNGHGSGTVLGHKLTLFADSFTPADEAMIPTGEIRSVDGTPMDFRTPKEIGKEIEADYEPLRFAGGYDHNYVLKSSFGNILPAALLEGEKSGITMEVLTDMPGVQLYTGNFLDGRKGKEGAKYPKRTGVCFETQFFPNACNEANFLSPILKGGEVYKSYTIFRFGHSD